MEREKFLGREGFEPSKAGPADLQSALVDRLSTYPLLRAIIFAQGGWSILFGK